MFARGAWSIVDERRGLEVLVCGSSGDAAELGTAIAREAGHGEFYMWDCDDLVVECWAPRDAGGYTGESFGKGGL